MSAILKKARNAWKEFTPSTTSNSNPTTERTIEAHLTTKSEKPEISTTSSISIVVIGAGQRGKAYSLYATSYPKECNIVAVAEPRPKTRAEFVEFHKIPESLSFETWQDVIAASARQLKETGRRLADAVIIAVQDHMHAEVVIAFAEQGFHMLCEKPMATSITDCIRMADAVKRAGVVFGIGHVFRYSPYALAITEVVRSGQLGQLVNAVQMEPVGYYHFAHSYVRGNWAKESESSFSLMTKCCHDMDIICHWLLPATPVRVSSFGSLTHFRKSQKPTLAGEAKRCLDCLAEGDCPYSAKKIYLDPVRRGHTGWPGGAIVDGTPDIENISEALTNGNYGLCVYESQNDVADHQCEKVVNMEFSTGATVSFTMVAFTTAICVRQTRLHFTHGELIGDMTTFTTHDFRTNKTKRHVPAYEGGGHGGGDRNIMRIWVKAVAEGRQELLGEGSTVDDVLKVHLAVFAAEESRKRGTVVRFEDFERTARETASVGW